MKKLTAFFQKLWKDESGQGMVEYGLLILVIVAIAVVFKDKIKEAVTAKMGNVADDITNFQAK